MLSRPNGDGDEVRAPAKEQERLEQTIGVLLPSLRVIGRVG
jgi:hypothetical protein